MTYFEAIVPACLELYREGKIVMDDSSVFHFRYISIKETIERRAMKISGMVVESDWYKLCTETQKAAALIKEVENSPLGRALA